MRIKKKWQLVHTEKIDLYYYIIFFVNLKTQTKSEEERSLMINLKEKASTAQTVHNL